MLWKKKEAAPQDAPPLRTPRKKRWIKILIILLVAVVAAAFILRACISGKETMSAMAESVYRYETVSRRDISQTLSYSGSLEPADSYEVTSLVTGEILDAPFEEGDVLEEGALLYSIDPSDAQTNIDKAELSLEQAQMNYDRALESMENLTVTAPKSGTIVSLDVEVGDDVQAGQQIGTLRDSGTMELTIPFHSADAANISVGDTASVTVDGSFETLTGTVTQVGAVDEALEGGAVARYVTIDVQNPGALSASSTASATINGAACSVSGTFAYKAEATITAQASGEVASISAGEGQWVEKGAAIVTLSSTELQNSLRSSEISLEDSKLSLENVQEQLENYQITSPISGTVIKKNYKAGDNLSANSTTAGSLCTIYDLSYLTMTLNVDELDISSIQVGQKVSITADAVEGKAFEGEVTSISVQGTTANGVTTYPVTIRIDETEGLLPGMNVDAQIVVESVSQVLSVPTSAVQRGNRVLVSVDSEAGKAALAAQEQEASNGEPAADSSVPEGYVYAEVTLGLSDDSYIEILDGLAEGDEIAYANSAQDSGMMPEMFGMEGVEVTTVPAGGMSPPDGGPGGGMGGR